MADNKSKNSKGSDPVDEALAAQGTPAPAENSWQETLTMAMEVLRAFMEAFGLKKGASSTFNDAADGKGMSGQEIAKQFGEVMNKMTASDAIIDMAEKVEKTELPDWYMKKIIEKAAADKTPDGAIVQAALADGKLEGRELVGIMAKAGNKPDKDGHLEPITSEAMAEAKTLGARFGITDETDVTGLARIVGKMNTQLAEMRTTIQSPEFANFAQAIQNSAAAFKQPARDPLPGPESPDKIFARMESASPADIRNAQYFALYGVGSDMARANVDPMDRNQFGLFVEHGAYYASTKAGQNLFADDDHRIIGPELAQAMANIGNSNMSAEPDPAFRKDTANLLAKFGITDEQTIGGVARYAAQNGQRLVGMGRAPEDSTNWKDAVTSFDVEFLESLDRNSLHRKPEPQPQPQPADPAPAVEERRSPAADPGHWRHNGPF